MTKNKSPFEIPTDVRKMTEQSMDQVRTAINGYLQFFQRAVPGAPMGGNELSNKVLTYAERTSGSGFQQVQAQYSLTGLAGSFTPLAAAENTTRDSVWRVRTFDFSAVNAIEGQSTVYLAVAMLNGTNTGGNIRIDNVQINGTSIPAPASAALVGVAGVFAARRRRAWFILLFLLLIAVLLLIIGNGVIALLRAIDRPTKPEVGAIQYATDFSAKAKQDRYQSAAGLRADLLVLRSRLAEEPMVAAFPLGRSDWSTELHLPQKLYGREAEAGTLVAAFERVATGSTELFLVTGPAGIGKSALVHEVHKAIARRGGVFVAGKFELLSQGVPYASLAQALRELVRQLLTEQSDSLLRWKDATLEAVGTSGQLLISLLPELEQRVGASSGTPTSSAPRGDAAQPSTSDRPRRDLTTEDLVDRRHRRPGKALGSRPRWR